MRTLCFFNLRSYFKNTNVFSAAVKNVYFTEIKDMHVFCSHSRHIHMALESSHLVYHYTINTRTKWMARIHCTTDLSTCVCVYSSIKKISWASSGNVVISDKCLLHRLLSSIWIKSDLYKCVEHNFTIMQFSVPVTFCHYDQSEVAESFMFCVFFAFINHFSVI